VAPVKEGVAGKKKKKAAAAASNKVAELVEDVVKPAL